MGKDDTITLVHDEQIEKEILGTMIQSVGSIEIWQEYGMGEDAFFLLKHKALYNALIGLHNSGEQIDTSNILNYAARHPYGNTQIEFFEVVDYMDYSVGCQGLPDKIRILKDLYDRRRMYNVSEELKACNNLSARAPEVRQSAINKLREMDTFPGSSIVTLRQALGEYLEELSDIEDGLRIPCIPSGFQFLDERKCFCPGRMTVIGADTSQGKTSFALSMLLNAAKEGVPSAFYSLEMCNSDLMQRLLNMKSTAPVSNSVDATEVAKTLRQFPMYFDEKATNPDTIIASIRGLVRKYKVRLVVIDYLQMMPVYGKAKGQTEESYLGETAHRLFDVSKELDISIVLLSQLSRGEENGSFPTLTRLRGSGQIEQAADVVVFVYRPEAFGKGYKGKFKDVDTNGTAEIIIAKNRNGEAQCSFIAGFDKNRTLFYELETVPRQVVSNEGAFAKR